MSDLPEEPKEGSVLRTWAWVIAIIVVPVLVTGLTQSFGWFTKNREYDIRMVEIGLSILRGDKGDKETSRPARRWALHLLSKYSGIPVKEPDFTAWEKNGITPFAQTGHNSYDIGWGDLATAPPQKKRGIIRKRKEKAAPLKSP